MALPSGYTKLTHVVFNGAQYVKTGIKTPTNNIDDIKIICKFSTTTSGKCFIGARKDTSTSAIIFGYFGTSSAYSGYGGSSTNKSTTINCMNGSLHTVILSKNLYKIDGVNQTIARGSFSTTPYEIFLGSWNNNGSVDSRYFVGNVYSFKIYKNGGLITDLIPCKNSSGVVGFYDDINSKFITNSGSGSFSAGSTSTNTVTYKTVINESIQGFNDIQVALTNFKSFLGDNVKVISETSSGVTNLMTAEQLRREIDKLSVIKNGSAYISGCIQEYDPTTDDGSNN